MFSFYLVLFSNVFRGNNDLNRFLILFGNDRMPKFELISLTRRRDALLYFKRSNRHRNCLLYLYFYHSFLNV